VSLLRYVRVLMVSKLQREDRVNLKFCINSPASHRDKIIIPLVQSKGSKKPKKHNFFNGSTIQPYSEVEIHDTFSFQLRFSMTVHKAQGRTIDKVVLDRTT
jgi:hypothetical protein